jgi:hypothetical protein
LTSSPEQYFARSTNHGPLTKQFSPAPCHSPSPRPSAPSSQSPYLTCPTDRYSTYKTVQTSKSIVFPLYEGVYGEQTCNSTHS